MTDWFEYRSKCSLCGWDGPDSEIKEHKQMGFAKFFGVCPGCGKWRTRDIVAMVNAGAGRFRPSYGHKSCLAGYAVHGACGKWHKPGTGCPNKRGG